MTTGDRCIFVHDRANVPVGTRGVVIKCGVMPYFGAAERARWRLGRLVPETVIFNELGWEVLI